MNAEPSVPTLQEPAQLTLLEVPDLAPPGQKKSRPHNKVARLPKILRDLINSMLDDGFPYHAITARLQQSTDPPLPYPISEMDISRWKDGGYQRHLAQQERFEYVTQYREAAQEMISADTTTLAEGALQIIASQYYDIFAHFSPELLKQKLAEDPLKYNRFLNVFARLTREIVHLKKHREHSATAASVQHKQPTQNPPSTANDDKYWLDRADDLFGFKSAERLKREAAAAGGPRPSSGAATSNEFTASEPAGASGHSQGAPPIPDVPEIRNAKSKIKNTTERGPSNPAPSPVQNQKSKIENRDASTSSPPQEERIEERRQPESSIQHPASSIEPPPIQNQKSKIKNSEELCYDCGAPLPPLLPSGQRPKISCIACGAKLYPPDATFDPCHCCGAAQPIWANGERVSPACRRCNSTLAPPGQRFVTHCPKCGFELPQLTCEGVRISDRCPDCRAPVPLLEPASSPIVTHAE